MKVMSEQELYDLLFDKVCAAKDADEPVVYELRVAPEEGFLTNCRLRRWLVPEKCSKCGRRLRKFATGEETPCRDCDGELCERCCDERKKAPCPNP